MTIRDDNKAIAQEAGLGYEVYSPQHVLTMASTTGDLCTVVAVVQAENSTSQAFLGHYSADEAYDVAARISRMRKFNVFDVYVIDPSALKHYVNGKAY